MGRSFASLLPPPPPPKQTKSRRGFLLQLFHSWMDGVTSITRNSLSSSIDRNRDGTVQFLVQLLRASLYNISGNVLFARLQTVTVYPVQRRKLYTALNKRKRRCASVRGGRLKLGRVTSFLRGIVCTQGIGAPELRCLSSSVDGAESGRPPPVSSRIMASVSFTDYGPGKERTSSAPSAWVNTRVCTLTRNEVEDEVVQKVVYSINGAAKTPS